MGFEEYRKSTFKKEFVTAECFNFKEGDYKTFESRLVKNLYLVGELDDIDSVMRGCIVVQNLKKIK